MSEIFQTKTKTVNIETERNKFHKEIGNVFNEQFNNCEIIKDKVCGGKHNIPLFCSDKSNGTEFCNVDILILQSDKIKILLEIDESNRKPTQIFGKFFTSALAKYHIHSTKTKIVEMDDKVLFVQIVSTKNIKSHSKKDVQWKNIEKAIQELLPLKNSNVVQYRLIYAKDNNITELKKNIIDTIDNFLK